MFEILKAGDDFDQNEKLKLTSDKFSSDTQLEQNFDIQLNFDYFVKWITWK